MRIATPVAAVSAGGQFAAVAVGVSVSVVDTATRASIRLTAPFAVQVVAVRDDGTVVVAAGDTVAVLSTRATGADDAPSAVLAGQVMLLSVLPHGTVAITRTGEGTALVALDAGARVVGEALALDRVALWRAQAVHSSSVLVWGVTGTRPWEGDGDPWAALFSLDRDGLRQTWSGHGLPSESELAAGANGLLAFVDGDAVILSTVEDLVHGDAESGRHVDVGGEIDSMAMSPNGTKACVVIAESPAPGSSSVASIDIGSSAASAPQPVGEDLQPIALGIGDAGRIVVVATRHNTAVVVLVGEGDGALVEAATVEVPRSIHRHDI